MQRPTLLEGILVACVAGLVTSPVMFTLRPWLGAAVAWKACIAVLASAYIVYLLARRGKTAGRITLAVLSFLTVLASLVFEMRWPSVLLVAMALIWGTRSYTYGGSLVAALLHGVLCLLGLGAALWAYTYSGSLALASWSFFLTQAAFTFVPPYLTRQPPPGERVTGDQESDDFVLAHQAAQKALARLRTWSVPGT
jgi:hypothetical protein